MSMTLVFNSPYYQVLEYPEINAFELLNHTRATGTLIQGDMASALRVNLQGLFATDPTEEDVDDMIADYEVIMNQPVHLH